MAAWHEQDETWELLGPILFGPERWTNAPSETDQVVSLLGIKPGERILDLCCGVGRHSLELARRGFAVTAVDRTAQYLSKARNQALAEGLKLEFVKQDMRAFVRAGAFDGALNLFTSFGYFEDQEDDRKVAGNIFKSLAFDGRWVLDMMGKEVLARVFRQRDWHEHEGHLMLEERKVSRSWSWAENRWIMLKGGKRHELRISHRVYSAMELSSLLRSAGFSRVDLYGGLDAVPYDHEAKRLVAVAWK